MATVKQLWLGSLVLAILMVSWIPFQFFASSVGDNNGPLISFDSANKRSSQHQTGIEEEGAPLQLLQEIKKTYDPNRTSLIPLQTLYEYIQHHSDPQLEVEFQNCQAQNKNQQIGNTKSRHKYHDCLKDRKFMLVYYSCPSEAGNRLHWFMNSVIWGMVTNRTVLWRYLDVEVCDSLRQHNATRFHVLNSSCGHRPNHKEDCDHSLNLAKWLPSFDTWNERLQLDNNSHGTDTNDNDDSRYSIFVDPPDANVTSHDDPDSNIRLIQIGDRYRFRDVKHFSKAAKDDPSMSKVMSQLEHHGHFFLYGMLLETVFSFPQHIQPSHTTLQQQPTSKDTKTVAIHVRHISAMDKGGNIEVETACLYKLLKDHQGPCATYLLSDRPLAVELLSNVSRDVFNCTPITTNHDSKVQQEKQSFSFGASYQKDLEHGPNAGAGFFRDLALAAHARHGFVTSRMEQKRGKNKTIALRSSSALLLELMEYRSVRDGLGPVTKCHFK